MSPTQPSFAEDSAKCADGGPYIFTDIYGVLNRELLSLPHRLHECDDENIIVTNQPGLDPRCVRPLNTLLMLFPASTLVITSTLRRHLTYRQLAATLSHHGIRFHRLATTARRHSPGVTRPEEIQAFLDTCTQRVPFVILDSIVDCAVFRHRFVLVNSTLGLTDDDASRAASSLIDQGVELPATTLHSFITHQEYPDHGIGAQRPRITNAVNVRFDIDRSSATNTVRGTASGFLRGTSGDVI